MTGHLTISALGILSETSFGEFDDFEAFESSTSRNAQSFVLGDEEVSFSETSFVMLSEDTSGDSFKVVTSGEECLSD